jgi:hypothetical protein
LKPAKSGTTHAGAVIGLGLAFGLLTSSACSPAALPAPPRVEPAPIARRASPSAEVPVTELTLWVQRLDDPAQRAAAIARIDHLFGKAMASARLANNHDDEKVKQLVDESVGPLASRYLAGGLDDNARRDLIKLLANMGDRRAARVYAKAFDDFEPGKTDDDVKLASQGTVRLVQSGQGIDRSLADALWNCFARFQPSKNPPSISLVPDLQYAVMVVKDESYGAKAAEMLAVPVTDPKDPAQALDQLQFRQATAARLIGELKFTPGVRPLVTVLVTPNKADLIFPVRLALTRMPKESEPVLIAALKGTDPEFAALAAGYPDKAFVPRVAEPLAYISRPAGRAAILEALENADNDQNRVVLAVQLAHFHSDANLVKAYGDAYKKVPPDAAIPLLGGGNGRAIIAQSAANLFDPTLTPWLLKENAAAKGDAADMMPAAALPAAIRLMTTASSKSVGDAIAKIPGQAIEKEMFRAASAVVVKCKQDAACYVSIFDTPVPVTPPAAKMGHVKAAWMAAIYGNDATRGELVAKLDSVKDSAVRLAMVEAIAHLAPRGDVAAAEKVEKIVAADKKAGANYAGDEVTKIALKLRSRVP